QARPGPENQARSICAAWKRKRPCKVATSISMYLQLRPESEDLQFSGRINWHPAAGEVGSSRRSAHQRENLGVRGRARRNFRKVKKIVAIAQPEEIVDASNLILGRMASYVAKKALDGRSMVVINAERAVISGTKERGVARAKLKLKARTLGNLEKSPTQPRKPDGYVRRVIRGMLPWKKTGGKGAFHRVKVYIGTPSEYQDRPATRVADADASRLRVPYITIAQLSGEIGGYPQ